MSVAVAADDGRSSNTDCEPGNSDSSDDGAVRKPSSGIQLWSATVSLVHTWDPSRG